jgi:16S rRNA (uracil1498-N3)-methyltransferase
MSQEEERDQAIELQDRELAEPGGKLRLHVEGALATGGSIAPTTDQEHYLLRVMRAEDGDRVSLFNGKDGEWLARIVLIGKRRCALVLESQTKVQEDVPDLWLIFAPIKRTPADFVAQKAVELGVRCLQPVLTHRTIARRVNPARLRANAVEAAEQSGRLSVPEIGELVRLPDLLRKWPATRKLIFCDESGEAPPIASALAEIGRTSDSWAILTGPEGGFDDTERALVRSLPYVIPVTLGPRIMRADTAALAALAVWQAISGDWQ